MFRDHAKLVLICGAMVSACRGDQGSSCTIQHGRDGTDTVSCSDGTSLKVNEPPAGNGGSSPSCTIQDNDNGSKTISCVDGTSVTVREAQGGAGSTAVGPSCTIEDNGDGTKTVSCADGTSVTVRDARGDAGSSAQSCSSAAGESGSLCAAAFPRRVVHACREEDTFVGLATVENVLQSATDTLGIDLVLRATDSAFDEPVSCMANFADCQPLSQSAAGYAPPTAECSTGQCFSADIPSGEVPSPRFIWKLLNQQGAGTMQVELPPGVLAIGPEWERATAVILQHNAVQGRPQTLVLYWNGFTRLKTLSAPDPCFGSSFILPPFEPVDQPAMETPRPELHPVIERISLLVDAKGRPQLHARGAWYDADRIRGLEVDWTLVMEEPPASGQEVQWHVSTRATPSRDWARSSLGKPGSRRIGIGAISSMYSGPGSFDADVFEVTPGRQVPASSLAGPSGTTLNGELQALQEGSTMTMARSQPSDHNASAPDLSLTVVRIH